MTISDDPDEDADNFDDDSVLDTLLDATPRDRLSPVNVETKNTEWPWKELTEPELGLDAGIVAWFQQRYNNWRESVQVVLQAWIAAHGDKHQVSLPVLSPPLLTYRPSEDQV